MRTIHALVTWDKLHAWGGWGGMGYYIALYNIALFWIILEIFFDQI